MQTAFEYFTAIVQTALTGFSVRSGNGMEYEQFLNKAVTEPKAVFISWTGFTSGQSAREFSESSESYTITIRTTKDDDIRAVTKSFFNAIHKKENKKRQFTNEDDVKKSVTLQAGTPEYGDYQKIEISAEVA